MKHRNRALAAAGLCLALLALIAPPRAAADTNLGTPIPCALPADAVTEVPAPFDKYMALTCTGAGQTLRPIGDNQWVFVFLNNSVMWLTSNNPEKPDLKPSTHFTKLSVAPPSADRLKTFQDELSHVLNSPLVYQSTILRMAEETSGGARKEIFLVIPPEDAKAPVLGVECTDDCIPMEDRPWLFVIAPAPASP